MDHLSVCQAPTSSLHPYKTPPFFETTLHIASQKGRTQRTFSCCIRRASPTSETTGAFGFEIAPVASFWTALTPPAAIVAAPFGRFSTLAQMEMWVGATDGEKPRRQWGHCSLRWARLLATPTPPLLLILWPSASVATVVVMGFVLLVLARMD